MKLSTTIILASLSMLAMAQQEQQTIVFSDSYTRISAGFSGMQIYSNVDETKYDTDLFAPGGTISLTYGKKLVEELDHSGATYMEIGAEFAYNTGSNITEGSSKYKVETCIDIMSATVPVSLCYKKMLTPQNYRFVLFGGISSKYNLSANMTYQIKGSDKKIEKDMFRKDDMGDNYVAERFQFGLHAGIGLDIDNIYIGYKINADLMPFHSYTYWDEEVNTRIASHTLSISFILGK